MRRISGTAGQSPARLGQGDGWGQGADRVWPDEDEPPLLPTPGRPEKTTAALASEPWVAGGIGHGTFAVPMLLVICPLLCQLLAYVASAIPAAPVHTDGVVELLSGCVDDPSGCAHGLANAALTPVPNIEAVKFLAAFAGTARALDFLIPGPTDFGIETQSGHMPTYVNNGVGHCVVFSALFLAGSNFCLDLYDFGIFYDVFPGCIATLNIFGMVLAAFLQYKGLNFPSTADSGTTGSFLADFAWGTELYPKVFGVDIKRFVNCRFSMTFWQLAGLSFAYKSYTLHGEIDWGLTLSAVSQYLYLFKFFMWEIGYLRSIDIIVDRAGWEIQWGCLVFVPSVYTFCTRILVRSPSQLELPVAAAIFACGFAGVILNYLADAQRQQFRASGGTMQIFGRDPVFVNARYTVIEDGQAKPRTSLLLASGFWGPARHFHYIFELMAAYSWCLLANPLVNGALPMLYCTFLTFLLLDRAKRDEGKCLKKYGDDFKEYMRLVPYLVIPGVY